MLQGIELLQLAGARMHYIQQRQSLISQNIANVDTPGYRARDLAPFRFATSLLAQNDQFQSPLRLVTSSPLHMQPENAAAAVEETSSETEKPDGNTVSLQEQMYKLSENATAFDLASTAYGQTIGILKMAIGTP